MSERPMTGVVPSGVLEYDPRSGEYTLTERLGRDEYGVAFLLYRFPPASETVDAALRCEHRTRTRSASGRVNTRRCTKPAMPNALANVGRFGGVFCVQHAAERA